MGNRVKESELIFRRRKKVKAHGEILTKKLHLARGNEIENMVLISQWPLVKGSDLRHSKPVFFHDAVEPRKNGCQETKRIVAMYE